VFSARPKCIPQPNFPVSIKLAHDSSPQVLAPKRLRRFGLGDWMVSYTNDVDPYKSFFPVCSNDNDWVYLLELGCGIQGHRLAAERAGLKAYEKAVSKHALVNCADSGTVR
jgi:hypothetical protein